MFFISSMRSTIFLLGMSILLMDKGVLGDANTTYSLVAGTPADMALPLSSLQGNIVQMVSAESTEPSGNMTAQASSFATCSCVGCPSTTIPARQTRTWSLTTPCSGGAMAAVSKYDITSMDSSSLSISTRPSPDATSQFTAGSWSSVTCVEQSNVNVGGAGSNIYIVVTCNNLVSQCPVEQDFQIVCLGGNTYTWTHRATSQCTASCGGGTQTTSYVCEDQNGQVADDSQCSGSNPSAVTACNTRSCGANSASSVAPYAALFLSGAAAFIMSA